MVIHKRIKWLDGLKGLACLAVFAHHFFLAFLPAAFYGDAGMSHTDNGWDIMLAQSPIGVVINGNFMVAIFCLVSGMVLSMQVMKLEDKKQISAIIVKRYPRLMLPIILMAISVYIMQSFGYFFINQLYR